MNTITIPLREDNLAEVLAGIGILGILESHAPRTNSSVWLRNALQIESPLSESELLTQVHAFLTNLHWVQSMGDVHQGVLKSGTILGASPFMDLANNGDPSVFKNFSGQVTSAKIATDQREALKSLGSQTFSEWLGMTVKEVSSWGLDWRTNAHSLDVGFSANDDSTSKFNPLYLAVDALAMAALSFFLPSACLSLREEALAYQLWQKPIPASAAAPAFLGNLNGLSSRTYQVTRRPKSYGKGASYKYFPAAVLQPSR
jgi:hypothetical protein